MTVGQRKLNRPGFVEALLCESARDGLLSELMVVVCLSFGQRDIPERLHEPVIVELGYPFQGGQFDLLRGFPRTAPVGQFGLVQPVDGLGQRIAIAVAATHMRDSFAE
jgi:hypothetical protein